MLLSGKHIKVTDHCSFTPPPPPVLAQQVGPPLMLRRSKGLTVFGVWVTLSPGEPVTHSAAGWCSVGLGDAGRESRAELDSGYGKRGCFMAVVLRLAGSCVWEASSPAFLLPAFQAFSLQSVSLPSWSIRNIQRS